MKAVSISLDSSHFLIRCSVMLSACICIYSSRVFAEDFQHSLSLQPIIWLDNLFPTTIVGLSGQYESSLAANKSIVGRLFWYHTPLFKESPTRSAGIGASAEYRVYFSAAKMGWHLGPFAEWTGYRWLGSRWRVFGDGVKHAIDIGAVAGHTWVVNDLVFDLSFRAAWFKHTSVYPTGEFFPRKDSNFNSHLLISIGHAY